MSISRKTRKITPFGLSIKKYSDESGLRLRDIENMLGMPKGYASQIIYGHKSGKRYKRDLIKLFEESAVKKENELRRELKNLEEERERNGGG